MKLTKKVMVNKIKEYVKVARENDKDLTRFYEINKIFAKNLEGRAFIHSKATKEQIENLLLDMISYITNLIEKGTL